MTAEEIESRVCRVADLRESLKALQADADARKEKILKPVKAQIESVDKWLAKSAAPLLDKLARAEGRAAEAVVELGATVKVPGLMAVYSPPKVSWDHAKLAGMVAFAPQLAEARKVAERGTVAFRNTKVEE